MTPLRIHFLFLLLVLLLIGCSSQKETIRPQPDARPAESGIRKDTVPSPAITRDEVSGDSLEPLADLDQDALLVKTREHLDRAEKALSTSDTVAAAMECERALRILDRLSYHPNIDSNEVFVKYSQHLISLYRKAAIPVDRFSGEMSISMLRDRVGEDISTIDVGTRTFTPPPPTEIPLPLNEPVEQNIIYFTTKLRSVYTRWLERSGRYFAMMRDILKEEGVPQELVFLTMIESGVNPTARSWAKCVGLWQFLKSTGESYGLRGDVYFDDRRNPEKSTRAAARHLRDLFNRYNDWHLALAAYNAGAGRIDRAIQRCDSAVKSYWNIRPLLPKETQNYVPFYIAASVIGLNPSAYEFNGISFDKPLEYDVVRVDKCVNVSEIARSLELTPEDFFTYNPFLLQSTTPPGLKNFEIRVPRGKAETAQQTIADLPEVQRPLFIVHRVKKGETVVNLSRRYGVSRTVIMHANNIRRMRKLRRGEKIRIPIAVNTRQNSIETAIDNQRSKSSSRVKGDPLARTKGREQRSHEVVRTESLGSIAKKYNVWVSDLMLWNSLGPNDRIREGQRLVVWVRPSGAAAADSTLAVSNPAITPELQQAVPLVKAEVSAVEEKGAPNDHRVRRGETLASIANAFNVTIEKLKSWNNIDGERVKTGSLLKIYPVGGDERTGADSIASRKESADVKLAALPPQAAPDPGSSVVEAPPAPPASQVQSAPVPEQHTVVPGETLWRIGQRYGISVDQLKEWNRLESENIPAGRTLALRPVERSPAHERHDTDDPPEPEYYTVQSGDNLWGISQRFQTTVDNLMRWNGLTERDVQAGKRIRIAAPIETERTDKQGTESIAAGSTSSMDESPKIHLVRRGDKLAQIARMYDVDVQSIRKWNGVKKDMIRIGQRLIVSDPALASSSRKSNPEGKSYMVEEGDTYYGISRKLGVDVKDLQRWNEDITTLRKGDRLVYH